MHGLIEQRELTTEYPALHESHTEMLVQVIQLGIVGQLEAMHSSRSGVGL